MSFLQRVDPWLWLGVRFVALVRGYDHRMVGEERCDICDLVVGTCEHTSAPRVFQARVNVDHLDVSPRHIAHLPGCDHKDDEDFSKWGEIWRDPTAAWQALGNGNNVPCDAGAVPDLIATSRCKTCEARN